MKNQRKRSGGKQKRAQRVATPPWWKQAWGRISIGTVLTVTALVYTYKTNGAQDLRTQVYQPLFADFNTLEQSVQTVSTESPGVKTLPELTGSGALERIPTKLREKILKANE